ncbi:MAG: hypothetical protein ACRD2O_03500, partial [Terriglobia bacterium]
MNHRFINHVICLNFDTLLDESLRDEMGYDGVDILVSDRDIEEAATFETSRGVDDKPRYLKPHGSISSPDSMRFTLRETSGMFRAMRSLVCRTIFGDDCAAHKPTDVILVMVGWACREQEFKRILGEGKDRIKRVYWLYPKDCEGVMQDHSIRPLGKEINAGKIRSLPFTLPQNGGRGLDGAFLDLFVGVVKQAHERRISLPPIARHLLYCYCFSPTQSEQRQWTEALTDGYPAHPTREDLS